ncbi:FMN-dependent NADH-azoreductase [Kordiimonas sp. SCSIO 12610]|uniref:FMN-dependent NADH-azoreductase n=1 Tax=Kordiimonas sp. SCSIO 12610 TaxID=2829597 RepID=UPI00210DD7E7|nr:NAD(P)H-dependent oxidoreductase [Kordiimonas sp. SCSIO 12610]UTW56536.1 NAD(P)H-dependent oxidoreductase [Kordiimonas sp. SCSIO 12610]
MTDTIQNILRIETSLQGENSTTKALSNLFFEELGNSGFTINQRDISKGLPLIDTDWVGANFTPEEDRSDAQKSALAFSDTLIAELEEADIITIGLPIYNFGAPASFKTWIDLIARARKTFRYTENGPVGLLTGKKVYIFVASGGTQVGSDIDFATTYAKHVLGFVGLNDVTIIAADQMATNGEESLNKARGKTIEAANALS